MKNKPSVMTRNDPLALPRFLAYALPKAHKSIRSTVHTYDEFVVHHEKLGSSVSFLDYDGIILLAGTFERGCDIEQNPKHVVNPNLADLDFRETEFYSTIRRGKPVIFLVPRLVHTVGAFTVNSQYDLFRRVADDFGLVWRCRERPSPYVESVTPDFRDYMTRFGTGYIEFTFDKDQRENVTPLCRNSDLIYGVVAFGRVFVIPSPIPQTESHLNDILEAAIRAAMAYRTRMSSLMPLWVNEFVFTREGGLRTQLEDLQKKALELEGEIGRYANFKGALCYQSAPLVTVVTTILRDVLDITLTVDDKCVEDASLLDENKKILAVFEIKGVKGNFARKDVNQVDSHRERLGLTADTPGILIMNTLMNASSMKEKDERPHPDIIKKAAADRVLLMRTIDLLRYANAVEQNSLTTEAFRTMILSESGWLKVENDLVTVVRK